jgi:hemerythrin
MEADNKMTCITIPSDLHRWLKIHAARRDRTMTEIVVDLLKKLKDESEE